jgi:hypothetical protein
MIDLKKFCACIKRKLTDEQDSEPQDESLSFAKSFASFKYFLPFSRVSASQEVTFNTEKKHSEWVLRLQPEKNRFCADRGE